MNDHAKRPPAEVSNTPKRLRVIDDSFTFWWGFAWLIFGCVYGFLYGFLMGAWLF